MTLLEKKDFERLKRLTKYYKNAYCKKNDKDGGYFIDFSKYKLSTKP